MYRNLTSGRIKRNKLKLGYPEIESKNTTTKNKPNLESARRTLTELKKEKDIDDDASPDPRHRILIIPQDGSYHTIEWIKFSEALLSTRIISNALVIKNIFIFFFLIRQNSRRHNNPLSIQLFTNPTTITGL